MFFINIRYFYDVCIGMVISNFKSGLDEESVYFSPIILISWGFALFEYIFQVLPIELVLRRKWIPFFVSIKNYSRGNYAYGITVFAILFFKTESFKWNHLAAFVCLILAVYFIFRKKIHV